MEKSDHIELSLVGTDEVDTLINISSKTFIDTFGDSNSNDDIALYVEHAFNQNKLLEELNNKNSYFFFAKINQKVVGYIKLNINDAQTEYQFNESLEIERIYLIGNHKHQGIGTRLLAYAILFAREHCKSYIWLGVWEQNKSAQTFYKKYGFYNVDEHQFLLGNEIQCDYIMRKDLV